MITLNWVFLAKLKIENSNFEKFLEHFESSLDYSIVMWLFSLICIKNFECSIFSNFRMFEFLSIQMFGDKNGNFRVADIIFWKNSNQEILNENALKKTAVNSRILT